MKLLVTCPGKFGDLLWAMVTVRAIAETYGERVAVFTSESYKSIVPLLHAQPYVDVAGSVAAWEVQDTAPMTPRVPPLIELPNRKYTTFAEGYDRVFHLGYDGWPQHPLPLEHWRLAEKQREWYASDPPLHDIDLARPWISAPYAPHAVPGRRWRDPIGVGFTDEHFELKYGLYQLLGYPTKFQLWWVGNSPRWTTEAGEGQWSWEAAATFLQSAQLFLGCCSALHVLAVAVGTPVVLMEPNPMRHNDIFYPLGKVGPQVTLVTGNDGLPTFDARAVAAMVESRLSHASEEAPRV